MGDYASRLLVLGTHHHPMRARGHQVVAEQCRRRRWVCRAGMARTGAVHSARIGSAAPGEPLAAHRWPSSQDWRARAEQVAALFPAPHLAVLDPDGFPLPFCTAGASPTGDGFEVDVPASAPWLALGPASLCFSGQATFVGRLEGSVFVVDRLLPDLPLVANTEEIFEPTPASRAALVDRLTAELDRRLQPVPTMPEEQP